METYARLIKLKPGSDAVHQQFKVDRWVRGATAEGRLLVAMLSREHPQ
jgi:hypothetical protein